MGIFFIHGFNKQTFFVWYKFSFILKINIISALQKFIEMRENDEKPADTKLKWSITIPSSGKFKTKCMYEV